MFFLKSLREKCPNTEFFLVRIFPHLVEIQERARKNPVFRNFSRRECFVEILSSYKNYQYITLKKSVHITRRQKIEGRGSLTQISAGNQDQGQGQRPGSGTGKHKGLIYNLLF